MAHSFVQVHDDEAEAFEAFARARPENLVLLIDTYDTEAAARKIASLAPKLKASGITVRGVRLDSGDMVALSKSVRRILDGEGLHDIAIFASGGLDEDILSEMLSSGAPIDGFGIGTSLTTSSDVPALDCAYKLQEYAGVPRRKRSAGKATLPGPKQVWRRYGPDGRIIGDVLSVASDSHPGEPLIQPVMRGGRRIEPPPLAEMRRRAAHDLERLPESLRELAPGPSRSPEVTEALLRLAAEVDRRLGFAEEAPSLREN